MRTFRILSWNVNGLRAAYKKGFSDWLLNERPDILCVQETKAQEQQVPQDLKKLSAYHTYFVSAVKKGYSGVGLFTKQKPKNIKKGFGFKKFDVEGRVIVADYRKFLLCNIYFPNGKTSKERLKFKMAFYDAFLNFVNVLKRKNEQIIVCGDVNTAHRDIDLARPKENRKISGFLPEERSWIDRLISHGYIDTFRAFNNEGGNYTWWDLKTRARERNIGWRIDYFFISNCLRKKLKSAFIMPQVRGSDHCPIGIELTF